MLNLKTNPVGIDAAIQKLQVYLHDALMPLWGMDPGVAAQNKLYQCYGRCDRNLREDSYIAEVFQGGKEYKEVYWNDTLNAISFFGTGSKEEYNGRMLADVHLVFFVNVAKVRTGITHRADEEARRDVQLLVQSPTYDFEYTDTEIWLQNVLREYPGSYREKRLIAVDMQPVHCFRLNFQLIYNKDLSNC